MGGEVRVKGLTKSFGKQLICGDVTLALPACEISVLLGPSGTGKSVFLTTLVGLVKPDRGEIWIEGKNLPRSASASPTGPASCSGCCSRTARCSGSMNLHDDIAFPLREHTKKGETDVKRIVGEKMELAGLVGDEKKLPGEISGGMRKRAGPRPRARARDHAVRRARLRPRPVRTAYLNQLIVDLNDQHPDRRAQDRPTRAGSG